MSRTESLQQSSEYWRYTAQAMDELLSETIAQDVYTKSGFHSRLLNAALEFLTIALGTRAQGRIEDPSASIANFGLAARALRDVNNKFTITEDEIQQQLSRFVEAIEGLRDQGLVADTVDVLPGLQRFFHQVFEAADSESYVSLVLHDAKMTTL